jgi:hypothetical protein
MWFSERIIVLFGGWWSTSRTVRFIPGHSAPCTHETGFQNPSGRFGETKNPLPLPGI